MQENEGEQEGEAIIDRTGTEPRLKVILENRTFSRVGMAY